MFLMSLHGSSLHTPAGRVLALNGPPRSALFGVALIGSVSTLCLLTTLPTHTCLQRVLMEMHLPSRNLAITNCVTVRRSC